MGKIAEWKIWAETSWVIVAFGFPVVEYLRIMSTDLDDLRLLAEWHEVKLQYAAVSTLCVPLSMVGIAARKLGPACDGVGFDPLRSSCQRASQGTNPPNSREENGFRLTSCHSAKSLSVQIRGDGSRTLYANNIIFPATLRWP
jgi:hypothetical protein